MFSLLGIFFDRLFFLSVRLVVITKNNHHHQEQQQYDDEEEVDDDGYDSHDDYDKLNQSRLPFSSYNSLYLTYNNRSCWCVLCYRDSTFWP